MGIDVNYAMSKPLPATRVTRDLIKQIVDLISKQVAELASSDDEFDKTMSRLTISISDKVGEEQFSFSDQLPQKFSGDTEGVEISINGAWGGGVEGLRISIKFVKNRSRISVAFAGKNPKTTVLGISESIISVVRSYGNSNSWAHHPGWVFIGTTTFNCLLALIMFATNLSEKSKWIVLTGLILSTVFHGLYLSLFPWLAPYTTYESFRDDSGADWRRWTIRAIISAFILSPFVVLIYSLF